MAEGVAKEAKEQLLWIGLYQILFDAGPLSSESLANRTASMAGGTMSKSSVYRRLVDMERAGWVSRKNPLQTVLGRPVDNWEVTPSIHKKIAMENLTKLLGPDAANTLYLTLEEYTFNINGQPLGEWVITALNGKLSSVGQSAAMCLIALFVDQLYHDSEDATEHAQVQMSLEEVRSTWDAVFKDALALVNAMELIGSSQVFEMLWHHGELVRPTKWSREWVENIEYDRQKAKKMLSPEWRNSPAKFQQFVAGALEKYHTWLGK